MILQAISTDVKYDGVPRFEASTVVLVDSEFAIHKRFVCLQKTNCDPIDILFDSPENLPVFWECPHCTAIAPEDSYYHPSF